MHTTRIQVVEVRKEHPDQITRRRIFIDGQEVIVDPAFSLVLKESLNALPEIHIAEQRVLYPTEIWWDGVLRLRDRGLLADIVREKD